MYLEAVKADIAHDLAVMEQKLIESTRCSHNTINQMCNYVNRNTGKRLRASIAILSAKACGYEGDDHITLACILELLHAATLLHDDVIDQADQRHNQAALHTVWGNTLSILSGDYLYAIAFKLLIQLQHPDILSLTADACKTVIQGEIKQHEHCRRFDTTLDDYFTIIQAKTATLFELAAQTGSMIGLNQADHNYALTQYGHHLGMAFQLSDDALDYCGKDEIRGKVIGEDLREGKPTFPFLWAIEKASKTERLNLKGVLEGTTEPDIQEILNIMSHTGALEQTKLQARNHANLACQALSSLPMSSYKAHLITIAQMAAERDY